MGTRIGLALGLAAGYVLGSKAGRERYEQIRSAAEQFMGSQTARHLEKGVRDAWDSARDEYPEVGSVFDLHDKLDGKRGT